MNQTRCILLRDADRTYSGGYRPQCTDTGDFAPMQCHAGTGECWCVRPDGSEIEGTKAHVPDRPDCSHDGMCCMF